MKTLIVAAGLLALGATAASAQYWGGRDRGYGYERPYYSERRGDWCAAQAARMRRYHREAVRYDGHVDLGERRVLTQMQMDYDANCSRRGRY